MEPLPPIHCAAIAHSHTKLTMNHTEFINIDTRTHAAGIFKGNAVRLLGLLAQFSEYNVRRLSVSNWGYVAQFGKVENSSSWRVAPVDVALWLKAVAIDRREQYSLVQHIIQLWSALCV